MTCSRLELPLFLAVSPPLLRAALNTLLRLESASLFDLSVALGAPQVQVKPVWDDLVADGRIICDSSGYWRPTALLRNLAQVPASAPLSRGKAAALLSSTISNAKEVNALGPHSIHYFVTELVVFGEYLGTSAAEIEDLDLAWKISPRSATFRQASRDQIYGRSTEARTRQLVRPKNQYVRISSMASMLLLNCPFQTVYTFEPPESLRD